MVDEPQNSGVDRRGQSRPNPTGPVGPVKPAVPIPRDIQVSIRQREAKNISRSAAITKSAGGTGMASPAGVIRNLPKTYSPLYEMSNLMLPRDMKTMNAWNRHFFACVDADNTQTYTDNGFKYLWEIDPAKDKIAVFNPETEELEFQFGEVYIYDYDSDIDGPMIHFQTKKVDIMTTAEHDMWVDCLDWKDCTTWKNQWKKVKAKDVKRCWNRFRSKVKWVGNEPESQEVIVADQEVDIEDYLRYLGLFLSEGYIGFSGAQTPAPAMVGIAQNEYRKNIRQEKFDIVQSCVQKMPFKVSLVKDTYYECNRSSSGEYGIYGMNIYGKKIAEHFMQYGRHSEDRFIPKWVKELKQEYLRILLEALILGDGTDSTSSDYGRIGTNSVRQVVYTSSSKQLADDVYEIAFKCGYVPTLATHTNRQGTLLYLVRFTDSEKGHYPVLKSNANKFKGKEKQEVSYKGKVYCFHVPPHNLFVIRRNGKITITGNTNPIVRNAITLHATYPISKFNIFCEDPKVKAFFEEMFNHMEFRKLLLGISLEFWKLGEAFPYLELDEENGVWSYGFLHNPDFIRIKSSPMARDPIITLIPDDSLKRIIQARSPGDAKLRQDMPREVINHIMRGEDIPLPNFNISHLKMMNSDYDIRGTSLITSVYKDLMLYDKIREMQMAQADGMINPLTLIKLGDPNGTWKPSDDDIRAFQGIIEESQYDPDFKIITHGAVSIERVGYAGSTLDVAGMWEAINKNLYTGLLAPEAILNGEGPNYSTASIGLEVLRTRYERFREQLASWIEQKVLEPICKLQDFYTRKGGERKLVVPKVVWNKLNLRDMDGYIATMIGLLATPDAAGKISDKLLFEVLDIDYNEEIKKRRQESIQRVVETREAEALQKMSLEELRTLDPDKPIVDTHKGEQTPTTSETSGGEGGEMGLGAPPGGLGGGGGGPPGLSEGPSPKGGEEPKGGGNEAPPAPTGGGGEGPPSAPSGPGPEIPK